MTFSGFGEVYGNLWLGLENIHQLTKVGSYTLRIELKRNDSAVGYAKYSNFYVQSEAERYKLNIGTFSGNVGDALFRQYFTTEDNDNDEADFNCATSWKGGWWYKSCFSANLNNHYFGGLVGDPTNDEGVMPQRMSWKTWSGKFGDITFSEMKLRKDD